MSHWIADAAHCREMDRRALTEFSIPVSDLMERAGIAVFDALKDFVAEGEYVSFLCGRGNNGGDGFVAARHALRAGLRVECLVAANELSDLSCDAKAMAIEARNAGVEILFAPNDQFPRRLEALACRDLIVDALLGTGLKGEVQGVVSQCIEAVNESGTPVVAVDIPSGINSDTGEEHGTSVWAMRTVTLGLPKPYLFQGMGLEHAGFWTVADIGFPADIMRSPTGAMIVDDPWVARYLPERLRSSHKGNNGHVLVIAGSYTMPGAAVLAVLGALRSGAGLVTVAAIPSVCQAVSKAVPEALLLPLEQESNGISPMAAFTLSELAPKWSSALIGPGLGQTEPIREFLRRLWSSWSMPSVIDADALNAVSEGVPLPAMPCLLTPHPGEMSRLLQVSTGEVQADRFATVRSAADQYQQTLLLKGPFSLVASPGEPTLVNGTGNPGMATGGMGDVLSGVAATLLAQELPPHLAGIVAAHWHGVSGDLCAEEIGSVGFLASEVAHVLPRARARIGLS
ncbi:MAG: NAD(P)H-hydrate dehydratase [Fimbriimonadaceae bacterium]|nr:NAD(P)H-hydrate dehydratase [Fimbriimonadaceae bacterium]